MDINKYYDETMKKFNSMSDDDFMQILKKIGVECECLT